MQISDIQNALALMEAQVGYSQARIALNNIAPGANPGNLRLIPEEDIPRVVAYIDASRIVQKTTFQVLLKDE